jgi:hypothetical protein
MIVQQPIDELHDHGRRPFTASAPFVDLSARLVPAPDRQRLPTSILERLDGDDTARLAKLIAWLAPTHHDELPGRIALREGRDVTAPRPRFAQKMALPMFFPSA